MLSGFMSLIMEHTSNAGRGDKNALVCLPVNESEAVDCLDRKNTLRHVEASDIFGKRVILNEHGHQVASG